VPLSPDKFLNAVPNKRELSTIHYLLIRSQKRKTILKYSHEERSDRLILASVQLHYVRASARKRYLCPINKLLNKGLVFSIDLVYLVNSVQIIYTH
ncbi:MAG: hypothetical protein ACYT04_97150, partial [Nostoc sp.]